ncbi:MAG: hypothetical protein K2X71_10260 [Methylobacterium sp.]|uniref:hypothetical protein n=1 Tax=Methylobacterium sp. TaxID=409 RepID=UPI00258AEBC5|nr:hypothetical protein [Methylobacterium sp.]MBY0296408.1 hypothetical protein [Methylobacterium sp.]
MKAPHALRRRPHPATRLRDAREAVAACERTIDDIVHRLHRGHTGLSKIGADDDAVIREARERLFSCRRHLDDIRLQLLAPEHPSLNPNDEDDMATALHLRLRANEEAEAAIGGVDIITAARDEWVLQVRGAL